MRSGRSLLASVMAVSLAALASACMSPLDEPLAADTVALRIVADPELADLPGCDDLDAGDVAGGEVLPTVHDDLYAVSVKGHLLCVDDGTGVIAVQRRGITFVDSVEPLSGTPLPARTGAVLIPDSDGTIASGTPLPANH